jgi:predicted Zn-ribbon and HTH transcriptional regulator
MLEALFSGIASFVIRVAPKVIGSVVRTVLSELKATPKPDWLPKRVSEGIDKLIERIKSYDQEISDREKVIARKQQPNPADVAQLQELERQKTEEFQKLEEVRKQESANELANSPEKFVASELTGSNTHLLQYHLGLIVLAKKCRTCGYPMRLQHKTMDDPSFADFFWQCTRFYVDDGRQKCRSSPFLASDIKLLHAKDVPELQIEKEDLVVIGGEKAIQNDTAIRMQDHLGTEDRDVLCPVHRIPQVLREKQGGARTPLLDRYHLRCSHFQCTQTTKLKSIAQLAAYLRRKEGVGIIH